MVTTEIIQKAKNGDERAFSLIYDKYVNRIYSFVLQRISHRETAEDLAADIFIKVYNSLTSYKDQENGNFNAWIYTIARHTIVDHWRQKMTHDAESFNDDIVAFDQTHYMEEFFYDFDPVLYPREEEQDDEVSLKKYFDLLSDKERMVVEERLIKTQSVKNTAELLNISESNVKVITHRALKKLSSLLPIKEL